MRICCAPPRAALSQDAAKRLEAIESMEELGAGFVLATHDLEIRGAGELLGERQSGQMTEIGMALYLDLLEEAVNALKDGREPALDKPLAAETEVELRSPAFLPESYIGDVHVRLALYKRIAASESVTEIDELNAADDRPLQHAAAAGAEPAAHRPAQARRTRPRYPAARPRAPGWVRDFRGEELHRSGGGHSHAAEGTRANTASTDLLKLRISRPMEKEDVRFDFATDLLKRLEVATPTSASGAKGTPTPAPQPKPSAPAAKPAKSEASSGGKRR